MERLLCVLYFMMCIGTLEAQVPPGYKPVDLQVVMDLSGGNDYQVYINKALKQMRQKIRYTDILSIFRYPNESIVKVAFLTYSDKETKFHNFTDSMDEIRTWLNTTSPTYNYYGHDKFHLILDEIENIPWNENATKIAILVTDGFDPSFYTKPPFTGGSDPISRARILALNDITLYIVGVEPFILPYKEFFDAIAYATGGMHVTTRAPRQLYDILDLLPWEWAHLKRLRGQVESELIKLDKTFNLRRVTRKLYTKLTALKQYGVLRLYKNNAILPGPSKFSKQLTKSSSLAETEMGRKLRRRIRQNKSRLLTKHTCLKQKDRRILEYQYNGAPIIMEKKILSGGVVMLYSRKQKLRPTSRRKCKRRNGRYDKELFGKTKGITKDHIDRLVRRLSYKYCGYC